jgi:hypothetical protein
MARQLLDREEAEGAVAENQAKKSVTQPRAGMMRRQASVEHQADSLRRDARAMTMTAAVGRQQAAGRARASAISQAAIDGLQRAHVPSLRVECCNQSCPGVTSPTRGAFLVNSAT